VDEDLAVLKPNGGDLGVNFLLTVTGCAIFSLGTMDEGRCFVVETVQTMGRLIHVCIILRHKLPSHFRWDDIIMRRITVGRGVTVGRSGIRHNGVEYAMSAEKRGQRRMREEI
jgi:hypothetical protein